MAGTIVANTLNTDTGVFSTNNAYNGIAKAWVNFNGVTTTTINSSLNVSSVTRNSTGNYTINFTTNMSNVNYVWSGNAGQNNVNNNAWISGPQNVAFSTWKTTGSITITTNYANVSQIDCVDVNLIVIGA